MDFDAPGARCAIAFQRVPVSSIGRTAPHLRRLHTSGCPALGLARKNYTPKPAPYIPVLKNGTCKGRKRYWYQLPSPSLVLDPVYPSDTLGLTFLMASARQ